MNIQAYKSSYSYQTQFADQIPLMGREGQQRIRNTKVFIAGANGVGSNVAIGLARTGFQCIAQCDPATVTATRGKQFEAWPRPEGRFRVHVIEEMLFLFDRIQHDRDFSYIPIPEVVTSNFAERHLRNSHVIISCTDDLESRQRLLRHAVRNERPLISASVRVHEFASGEVALYLPDSPLCCPECGALKEQPDSDSAPFFPSFQILGGLIADLACALTSDFDRQNQRRPTYFQYDGRRRLLKAFDLLRDPNCEFCSKRRLFRAS